MKWLTIGHAGIVVAGILLSGCDGISQIAKGVADNAPPAKEPEIVGATKLYKWSGPTDFFLIEGNSTFEIDVSYGLANHLTVMKENVEVPEFDGNDPNNGAKTVKTIQELSNDPNAQTVRSQIKIFLPQGGYPEDEVATFKLVEESINPKYKGTAQERAEKTFTATFPSAPQGVTAYMRRCFKSGVPLPPDWAPTGTPWVAHGNLKNGTNLLAPGENAFVWTSSDPKFRGACIALPRGNGGARGGIAGTICQSAVTGRACFWDSRKRDDTDPMKESPVLDWSQGLTMSELKDGSNLTESGSGVCPQCHRGNNVFLIAPDDPTWANVLRNTALASTFTTKIETSSDLGAGHARYIPLTSATGPGRAGWENPSEPAAGCGGNCHETFPTLPFSTTSLTSLRANMPPGCASGGVAQNCYRF